jgi:hypothetical protein
MEINKCIKILASSIKNEAIRIHISHVHNKKKPTRIVDKDHLLEKMSAFFKIS